MRPPPEVERAVVEAHREWGVVLAATVRAAHDLDLAEDCVQEAYAAALTAWTRDGIPRRPAAWLTAIARRRVADAVRRETRLRARLPLLIEPLAEPGETDAPAPTQGGAVPDERLRLVFMCCHPALAPEAQMALTLRLVCGLSTADIARAFLVAEPTMAARLTRAKHKIAAARIPLRVPSGADLPERLQTVLGVIYLLFTTGHTAPSGPSLLRSELTEQALRLTRVLRGLMPDEPEVGGLLALLLVAGARSATRVDAGGELVRLADQDRSRWDRAALAEARALIEEGLRHGGAGQFLIEAAIASLHAEAPTYEQTDWPQIVRLYDALVRVRPSPVVALNRAVAVSMVCGPGAGLAQVEELERDGRLAGYHYLPAVKADLLQRLGRSDEAAGALRQALELARNESERAHLTARLASLRSG